MRKLARLVVGSGLVLALSGTALRGSASPASGGSAVRLRVRAPHLERPLSESFPDPFRPADPVKAAVLARINEDRARFGQPPVAWDEAASRVADAFCAHQIQERSRGHFLMDGVPPYGRMGFAGVFGINSENSVSWVTSGSRFSESTIFLALSGQEQMMEERPPRDGHRQTILDPEATHVGVGYAIRAGRFQMSQEFLTRRLDRVTLAAGDPLRAGVTVSGKASAGWRLRFVTIAREEPPRPMTREEATARTSYSYPRATLAYVPEGHVSLTVVGMATEDRVRMLPGREFVFPFAPDRPGLYTFQLYVARDSEPARPGGGATLWVE